MYIISSLEEQLMREIDAVSKRLTQSNLGGVSGSGGGAGTPPGGFIGQLAQRYVTFDTTEDTSDLIPISGASLVTNLNRIRGGWALGDGSIQQRHLASGIAVPTITTIEVEDEDEFYNNINNLRFINAEIEHTDTNQITITIPTVAGFPTSSGIGNRFQTYVWSLDGTLSDNIPSDHIYQFADPFYVTKLVTVSEVPGTIDTTINLQGSSDGIVWTDLLTPDITIGAGEYYTETTISALTLNSGILLRNLVKVGGDLQSLDVILEGTVNVSILGGGGLSGLEPLRVVITDVSGNGTTTDNLRYDGTLSQDSISNTESSDIKLNRKYATEDPILNGTILGSIKTGGFDGISIVENRGNIKFVASEDWFEGIHGTSFIVEITPIGEDIPIQGLILTDDGDLSIGGDLFAGKALITELYVGAADLNTSLAGRTKNLTVINETNDLSASTPSFTTAIFQDTEVKPSTLISLHARGTRHVPLPTLTGDVMARITGRGYWGGPGNDYAQSSRARIDFISTDDYTEFAQGGKVEIYTTPSGTFDTTLAMTIHDSGVTEVSGIKLSHSTIAGQVLTAIDTIGNLELRDPVGGSSNYDPDHVPSSPSSYDDEFNDDVLDVKWIVSSNDENFDLIQSDGARHLSESIHHGYLTLQGDYSVLGGDFNQDFTPLDDEWTLVAKILPAYTPDEDVYTSFGVYGADPSNNFIQARIGTRDNFAGITSVYNDNTAPSVGYNRSYPIANGVYIMITNDVGTYSIFASTNGVSWYPIDVSRPFTTLNSADLTKLYFGLGGGTTNAMGAVDFIRYWPNSYHYNIGSN